MQFRVIYLETWGSTQPCVAFLTLEFRSCFFVFGGICKALNFLHCTSQCLLCFVSSHFSWLMDGACFPCLVVETLNGLRVC